ncbi:MAG: hypothetical protein E7627_04495 [Ruminococcaceae bacterium]|nr:hypothetical protein [Oscillospiraceae bacterium]
MAYCYNCGIEIPDGDKMKLCERCKKILLPFIKFMDASTSSAVRRLVSNERNLRNAGVTDSGMEYLLRLCELHDQKRIRDREEREAARAAQIQMQQENRNEIPAQAEPVIEKFADVEIPPDEPLCYCEKPYGKGLTIAQILFILCGVGLAAWFAVQLILNDTLEIGSIIGAVSSVLGACLVGVIKKLHHDLHELKKRFK